MSGDDQITKADISMHRIAVGGGIGGLIFAAGTCAIFLVGVPALRWFLFGSLLVGIAAGWGIWYWHKKKPVEITDLEELDR